MRLVGVMASIHALTGSFVVASVVWMPMKFACGQRPLEGDGFGRVETGLVDEMFHRVSRAAASGFLLPLLAK